MKTPTTIATVAEYFEKKLGAPISLVSAAAPQTPAQQSELNIEIGCGVQCRAAIDMAAAFLDHIRADRPELIDDLRRKCNEAICGYVHSEFFVEDSAVPTNTPTVADYFEEKLGAALDLDSDARAEPIPVHSPAHPDFHIDTGCGAECRAAIDMAAAFTDHIRAAYGNDRPELILAVRRACNDVVCCFVYG